MTHSVTASVYDAHGAGISRCLRSVRFALRTINRRYDKRVARGTPSTPDRQVLSARVQIPAQFVDFTSSACDDLPIPQQISRWLRAWRRR